MLQNKIQQALRNAKNRGSEDGGFTLIELLVVILIIGILAAIALPTFLGQSDKAKDASAKSDVRNAYSKVESCVTDDTLTNCVAADKLPASVTLRVTSPVGTENAYSIQSTSETGNIFRIAKAAPGTTTRSCVAVKTDAGCSTKSWGVVDPS